MSSNRIQTKQLQKKIVSVVESDMNELKPRMIDHLRISKPPCSTKLTTERDSEGGAKYVEDGSVAMRSGTVQRSKMHVCIVWLGFLPEETNYPVYIKGSETYSLPKRPRKTQTKFIRRQSKTLRS